MTPEMILQKANVAGVMLTITPAGSLKARGGQARVKQLIPYLAEYKSEILRLIQQASDIQDYSKPYMDKDELRIPSNCHPKYKWWADGQTVLATLVELKATSDIVSRYTWGNSG